MAHTCTWTVHIPGKTWISGSTNLKLKKINLHKTHLTYIVKYQVYLFSYESFMTKTLLLKIFLGKVYSDALSENLIGTHAL